MCYSLNSLNGGYMGDFIGEFSRGSKGAYEECRLQLI